MPAPKIHGGGCYANVAMGARFADMNTDAILQKANDSAPDAATAQFWEGAPAYIVEIEWSGPTPAFPAPAPRYVGPFVTHDEATAWGERVIGDGTWCVAPLAARHG